MGGVCCGVGRLVSFGRRVAAFVLLFCTVCMVFGPGFPYKLGQFLSIYSGGGYDHLIPQKKEMKSIPWIYKESYENL